MSLKQISVNYDERQDRLRVRLNTVDGAELRLWFTRRFTAAVLPTLREQAGHPESPARAADPAQRLAAEMRWEDTIRTADFSRGFEPGRTAGAPGGDEWLVTDLRLTPRDDGAELVFAERPSADAGQSRELRTQLSRPVLTAFVHLIDLALAHAGWDAAPLGVDLSGASARPAGSVPTVLH